ncbi:MAG: 4'-phosphopantetheinyl transferase superfamily protein [Bacteroidetes bacterium]|nr:4'-phosphopantetheinyl transferase superfamily protein [Bacteroidota bacterium]
MIFEKNLSGARLGVWHIIESEDFLRFNSRAFPEDIATVDSYKNESRRKQWLACRALIARMLHLEAVKITYDGYGKPSLNGFQGYISFSHTREYAAVLINENDPAGIDIEKLTSRIHRVADRFLQPDELEHIKRLAGKMVTGERCQLTQADSDNTECHPQTELLYLYWCAKEALYKFYGKPDVDLKNDIHISPFDYFCISQDTFAARVNFQEGAKDHELQFERIGDHMLVYTFSKQG